MKIFGKMDGPQTIERASRIFRPTVLQHETDERSQNMTNQDEKPSTISTAEQRLPSQNYVLLPWFQLQHQGLSHFNMSDLLGPKTKGACPLGCPITTCPDQKHLQVVSNEDGPLRNKTTPFYAQNSNRVSKDASYDYSNKDLATLNLNDGGKSEGTESVNKDTVESKASTDEEPKRSIRRKRYKCQFCTVACSNMGQFRGHLRCHTGERPFVCSVKGCARKFARNEELTRHKRIHSGVRPFMCEICQKTFGRKDHLQKHSKTHLTPNEKKSYLCPVCCQGYSRSDALSRHKATAHCS